MCGKIYQYKVFSTEVKTSKQDFHHLWCGALLSYFDEIWTSKRPKAPWIIEIISKILVKECKSWQLKLQKEGGRGQWDKITFGYIGMCHTVTLYFFSYMFKWILSHSPQKRYNGIMSHCTYVLILLYSVQCVVTVRHKQDTVITEHTWAFHYLCSHKKASRFTFLKCSNTIDAVCTKVLQASLGHHLQEKLRKKVLGVFFDVFISGMIILLTLHTFVTLTIAVHNFVISNKFKQHFFPRFYQFVPFK